MPQLRSEMRDPVATAVGFDADASPMRNVAIVDFESFPIDDRPGYPPEPVGAAIDVPGRRPRYYAWGHPGGGNNCTFMEGRAALAEVWDSDREVCFHHAKFDLAVASARMGLPVLPWKRVHDTMLLLYLDDPRVATFALKPSAERLLGEPPTERDEMIDWLVENVRPGGHRLSKSKKSEWYAGAFVAYAPPELAGRYAVGDVTRARKLLDLLHPRVVRECGMGAAYDRERKLVPIAMELEEQGVRVDVRRLARDVDRYRDVSSRVDAWLVKRLRAPSDVNWNATEELAKYLIRGKAVDRAKLGRGKTGRYLTNKEALEAALTDTQVGAVLAYRSKLKTDLRTFMEPWLATARASGGYIFTTWHSTRSDDNGTKTGRFSSSPNFQNMPKEVEPIFHHEDPDLGLPRAPVELPALPMIRSYVVPYEDGDELIDRDYSQQEFRILGHYEDGPLLRAYQADPWMDIHEHTQTLVNEMLHANFKRKPIKNTGFGIVYGLGLEKLARKSRCEVVVADKLRRTVRALYPGISVLTREMKRRAAAGEPIRTWGGRVYYCEEPKLVELPNGQKTWKTYDYRMLNLEIQGSAADCTKEALIRYCAAKPKHHRVLTIPHDEILASVPRAERDEGMEVMRSAMESVEFDVKMLSEGKWGATNWAELRDYDKRGELLCRRR